MLRYKLIVFFIFILIIVSFNYVKANELPLFGKIIYVDIGHGGKDPGAIYKDIYEKDINLSIGLKIQKKLEEMGAIVYLTRYGDYDLSVTYTINNKRSDLSRRSNMINKSDADMFISIHLNSESTGTWRGAQVFYNSKLKENAKIADIFQKIFQKNLYSKRKAKVDNSLYLLKRINRPGVLLELGFLSNANDRYLLRQKTYQEKISIIISNGIVNYFK